MSRQRPEAVSLRKAAAELECVLFLPAGQLVVVENSGLIGQKSSCIATVYFVQRDGPVIEAAHRFYEQGSDVPDEAQAMRYEHPMETWLYEICAGGKIAEPEQAVSRLSIWDDYGRANILEWIAPSTLSPSSAGCSGDSLHRASWDDSDGRVVDLSDEEVIELGLNQVQGDLLRFHGAVFCISSEQFMVYGNASQSAGS